MGRGGGSEATAAYGSRGLGSEVTTAGGEPRTPPADPPGPPGEVRTSVGTLQVSPEDQVIAPVLRRDGVWEPAETRFVAATVRPGHTFVDVGAHVGYFSVLACSRVGPSGRVIALEPEPHNFALLRANVERNRCAQSTVLQLAAGSANGPMSLEVHPRNGGAHRVLPPGETPTTVQCVRLDDVLPERVNMVKIDVQGYDHEVVHGMRRTVAANPQLIVIAELSLIELGRREFSPPAVLEGYRRLGFTISAFGLGGTLREVTDEEILQACRIRGRDLSVVLERRLAPRRFGASGPPPRAVGGIELTGGGDAVTVLQRTRSRAHRLNRSAGRVLELCTGENSVPEIAELAGEAFALIRLPSADVVSCLDQLSAAGLVV
jgi:FkbM family methyltransferase